MRDITIINELKITINDLENKIKDMEKEIEITKKKDVKAKRVAIISAIVAMCFHIAAPFIPVPITVTAIILYMAIVLTIGIISRNYEDKQQKYQEEIKNSQETIEKLKLKLDKLTSESEPIYTPKISFNLTQENNSPSSFKNSQHQLRR